MKKIRKHLSPGVVLGAVALAVALGGTAVAGPGKPVTAVKVKAAAGTLVLPAQSNNQGLAEGTVDCPGRTELVGGGFSVDNPTETDSQELIESYPSGKRSWTVRVDNDEATARVGAAYALCLKVKK